MALRETIYGGECPLGKFEVDIAGGGGCYTNDPLEACLGCNFADLEVEFNLEKVCQCPSDMTWDKYDVLRHEYAASTDKPTRKGFWKYVADHYNEEKV